MSTLTIADVSVCVRYSASVFTFIHIHSRNYIVCDYDNTRQEMKKKMKIAKKKKIAGKFSCIYSYNVILMVHVNVQRKSF